MTVLGRTFHAKFRVLVDFIHRLEGGSDVAFPLKSISDRLAVGMFSSMKPASRHLTLVGGYEE